ncbi:MAG: ATP-binding protein, partial [Gemmatimonadaceae bacterium]
MSGIPDPAASPEVVNTLLVEDLEEAYDLGPAGYVSTFPNGTIVKVNATFLSWTGFERSDLEGRRRMQDLLSIAGRIYYETHLGPLLTMQGALSAIAVDIIRRDGTSLPAIMNASQKRTATGEVVLNRFTVIDATDRRRYERQLLDARRAAEAATQAKSEVLAMLSHDVRTPLGSVMSVAAILERTPLTHDQQQAVRILKSSVASMLLLVNGILDQERLDAVGVAPGDRHFDMRALVGGLVANLAPLARDKGLTLRGVIDNRLPDAVLGDPTKLVQVLNNLVGNAVKFTDTGEITLELAVVRLGSDDVRLSFMVRDTGIGIAPEALRRIFEEYVQANEGITERYGGTGLGLSISRRLLKTLGSDLEVQSTLGEG